MSTLIWEPPDDLTEREKSLLKTVKRTRKLFGFLRLHRRALFDADFQAELSAVYRDTGAGKAPHPPAFMATVVLLQAYTGASDAEAVQRSVVDLLWQMVLDCLGQTKAPFSQGALHDFRKRLIAHDLDRVLLERTAGLATESGAFDGRKLPKTLRVATDSKPLRGAGRVEDTINLLGRSAKEVVRCVAELIDEDFEGVARNAGIPIVLESSTKLALDIDWTDPNQKARALQRLVNQLRRLLGYVQLKLPEKSESPPLCDTIGTLKQIMEQDLEPDPDDPDGSRVVIRQGVAKDRRVSVRDPDMRHGRKTRTKPFNGFKQHIAVDLDRRLILAAEVVSANQREFDALVPLGRDLDSYDTPLGELYVDRGYMTAELPDEAREDGWVLISKPRQMPPNDGRFTKRDFKFDLRSKTVTCPAGQRRDFVPGRLSYFDAPTCESCELRSKCTTSSRGRGLQIAVDEIAQQRFLRQVRTAKGRSRLRERIAVEHRLAHLKQKQGDRARYTGKRANLFDLRRTAAVLNLEVIDQELKRAA